MRMPFGKYRGCEVDTLPPQYLEWLWENCDLREPLLSAVREALDLEEEDDTPAPRSALSPEVRAMAKELVSTGYRMLALKLHPDRNGSHAPIVVLNKVKKWLDKVAS
jgi:hypothetical protein